MERHGHDDVDGRKLFVADAGEPLTEGRGRIGSVAMLEGQQQMTRRLVIGHRRPRPVEGGGLSRTGAADRVQPGVVGKGITADPAQGGADEMDGAPAFGAEAALLGNRGLAAEAAGRQGKIQHPRHGGGETRANRSRFRSLSKGHHRVMTPGPPAVKMRHPKRIATETMAALPHLPFDRRLLRRRRERHAAGLEAYDFLFVEVAARLADRLCDVNRRFALGADLGCHRGELARVLSPLGRVDRLVSADLALAMARRAPAPRLVMDEEAIPFAEASLDLVVSNFSLHWVNDLPGTLLQIRRALKPDGLFLAALPGAETLGPLRRALLLAESEIRGGAAPRVSPFVELRDAGALLQRAGFALPVVDRDRIAVTYREPLTLFHDLRGMGESSALVEGPRGLASRRVIARAAEILAAEGGGAEVEFEVLYLAAWAPAESQPRPRPPGSATTRLADALGTDETRLDGGKKPS